MYSLSNVIIAHHIFPWNSLQAPFPVLCSKHVCNNLAPLFAIIHDFELYRLKFYFAPSPGFIRLSRWFHKSYFCLFCLSHHPLWLHNWFRSFVYVKRRMVPFSKLYMNNVDFCCCYCFGCWLFLNSCCYRFYKYRWSAWADGSIRYFLVVSPWHTFEWVIWFSYLWEFYMYFKLLPYSSWSVGDVGEAQWKSIWLNW